MDEHLPFLKAIAANPADDLPRLVFADFLEESGEPDAIARAHFIRAQIALTQLTPRTKEYRETDALQKRILRLYSEDWRWELPESLRQDENIEWRRGFIEFVTMSWSQFLEGAALFETVPITRVLIDHVHLNLDATVEMVEAFPHIRRITHLHFGPQSWSVYLTWSNAASAQLFDLLQARNFIGLTHLNLSSNSIDSASLASFILRFGETAFAPTLHTLDLSSLHGLDDAVGNALATARGLESIAHLNLARTQLSESVQAMLHRRFGDRVAF